MSNSADAPPPASPTTSPQPLGRIALSLGIATLVSGAIAGLGWIVPALSTSSSWLAVLLGIATIVVGIIAIVKGRSRKQAIIGLVLAVATGPVAFVLAFVTTMIMLIGHYGISG